MANEDAEELLKMKYETKIEVKIPEASEANVPLSFKLLSKEQEIIELDDLIALERVEYLHKMNKLETRNAEVKKKAIVLKDSLKGFEKFISENDRKKVKALKKAEDEREVQRSKDKELGRVLEKNRMLLENKDDLLRLVKKYEYFPEFVDKVVELNTQFTSYADVIAKYQNLSIANEEMVKDSYRLQKVLENEKDKLIKFSEEKKNEILTISNRLADLQLQYDIAHSKTVRAENKWFTLKKNSLAKTLVYGQTKMSINNIYALVNKYHKSDIDDEDYIQQLKKIQNFIKDWVDVVEEINKQEEARSNVATPSHSTASRV